MPSSDQFDPWQVPEGGFRGNADNRAAGRSCLQVEVIENVEPLDLQFGVLPKKAVPDALHDVLFGQPAINEVENTVAGGDRAAIYPMQLYAILDAAKVENLPELLETSRLEHRCLVKGDTYDELKNVAPWIVRLEDGNDFTRRLFTGPDGINGLWDKEPGIYVRSRGSLDEMWPHFRKFTRVRDENGKWFYFAFWEPGSLSWLALHGPWELLNSLMKPGLVQEILAFSEGSHVRIGNSDSPGVRGPVPSSFVLDTMTWMSLGRFAEKRFYNRLRAACLRSSDSTERHVDVALGNLRAEGFRARSVLWDLAHWWSTAEGAETMERNWMKVELMASRGLPDTIRRDRLRNLCEEKISQAGAAKKRLVDGE